MTFRELEGVEVHNRINDCKGKDSILVAPPPMTVPSHLQTGSLKLLQSSMDYLVARLRWQGATAKIEPLLWEQVQALASSRATQGNVKFDYILNRDSDSNSPPYPPPPPRGGGGGFTCILVLTITAKVASNCYGKLLYVKKVEYVLLHLCTMSPPPPKRQ